MSFNINDHPQKRQYLLTEMCDNLFGISVDSLFGLNQLLQQYYYTAEGVAKRLSEFPKTHYKNLNTY